MEDTKVDVVISQIRNLLSDSESKDAFAAKFEKWIDVLQEHGICTLNYDPTFDIGEEEELFVALVGLRCAGFVFSDQEGNLFGELSKAKPTSNEWAEMMRADFKVIE